MSRWIIGGVALIAVLTGVLFALGSSYKGGQPFAAADYKDAEYSIEGEQVRLKGGISKIELLPGSASKVVTRYFGNEVRADLNGDGREDVAFLLTQERGGSGTFFYAVAALNTDRGYVGSDGYLLGDRIAPQTTHMSQNPRHRQVVVVNYADRAVGEPMTVQPSIGKSVFLKLDRTIRWGIVEPNFEGEADVSRMIQVSRPLPGEKVVSPLIVTGKAVGNWYFEASFPIRILDADGRELGVVPAEARGDWMTREFVPFETALVFKRPLTETGTLVLQKDNPSGLPEHDMELRIPVSF